MLLGFLLVPFTGVSQGTVPWGVTWGCPWGAPEAHFRNYLNVNPKRFPEMLSVVPNMRDRRAGYVLKAGARGRERQSLLINQLGRPRGESVCPGNAISGTH